LFTSSSSSSDGQLAHVYDLAAAAAASSFGVFFFFLLIAFVAQRLAQLRTIAVQSTGFDTQLPAQVVAIFYFFNRSLVWQVDGLRDSAADERLT
jgi:hypothetical protein